VGAPGESEILADVARLLGDFGGRQYSGAIGPETRFFGDLGLASIDAVVLGGLSLGLPAFDAIFHQQQEMFQTGDFRGVLLRIAESAGVSETQFNACLNDDAAMKALNERVTRAVQVDKVTGTPTFFFNGKQVAEGEVSEAQLDQAFTAASK